MSAAKQTIDHATIKSWVKERGGRPARVRENTEEGGILRIDFGEPEDSLEEMSWEEFFEVFDDRKLAFLYQERTDSGKTSRFVKFVRR